MDFTYTAEEEAFRDAVRRWARSQLPPGWGETVHEPLDADARAQVRLDWERKLFAGGWSGINWPKEYGGRGATLVEQVIFLEEMARLRAPFGLNIIGRNLIGPTLIRHGTEAQKRRFLPKILSSEEVWAQGFSEPNAGSDLASVRTRARLDGEDFVVDGQKVWTSFAQYAQWCFLLVRTDPQAPKHKGLSFLLLDLATPGVTIRPLRQINGDSEFNEVFLDDVRIPRDNLVGGLNEGWSIAMTTLTFERGAEEAMPRQIQFMQSLLATIRGARERQRHGAPATQDPVLRERIARSFMEIELVRLNCLRGFSKELAGKPLGTESAFTKLFWSEAWQRMSEMALVLAGPEAMLMPGDAAAFVDGHPAMEFLASRAASIYSGTNEIQRNIVAERVLGLPR